MDDGWFNKEGVKKIINDNATHFLNKHDTDENKKKKQKITHTKQFINKN